MSVVYLCRWVALSLTCIPHLLISIKKYERRNFEFRRNRKNIMIKTSENSKERQWKAWKKPANLKIHVHIHRSYIYIALECIVRKKGYSYLRNNKANWTSLCVVLGEPVIFVFVHFFTYYVVNKQENYFFIYIYYPVSNQAFFWHFDVLCSSRNYLCIKYRFETLVLFSLLTELHVMNNK